MERGGKYEGRERIFWGDDCLHLLKLRTVHKKGQNVLYVNYNSVNLIHTQKGNKEQYALMTDFPSNSPLIFTDVHRHTFI